MITSRSLPVYLMYSHISCINLLHFLLSLTLQKFNYFVLSKATSTSGSLPSYDIKCIILGEKFSPNWIRSEYSTRFSSTTKSTKEEMWLRHSIFNSIPTILRVVKADCDSVLWRSKLYIRGAVVIPFSPPDNDKSSQSMSTR